MKTIELLECKNCNKIREEITLEDLNDEPELHTAIERIYDHGNTILRCPKCGAVSVLSPFQNF